MISSGLSSLLWFVAIIAMIPASLWFLKRTPMGGAASNGVMRSVAVLPLSASQRIVTIEVGQGEARRWLVQASRHQARLKRRIRSLGVTMSVRRMPNFSFTTTTSPWAIR